MCWITWSPLSVFKKWLTFPILKIVRYDNCVVFVLFLVQLSLVFCSWLVQLFLLVYCIITLQLKIITFMYIRPAPSIRMQWKRNLEMHLFSSSIIYNNYTKKSIPSMAINRLWTLTKLLGNVRCINKKCIFANFQSLRSNVLNVFKWKRHSWLFRLLYPKVNALVGCIFVFCIDTSKINKTIWLVLAF